MRTTLNSMIYSADMGVGKVAGIKLDQATGEMKTAFVLDDTTSAFQPLIGPRDRRVLLLSNMKKNLEAEPLFVALVTGTYTEQVTWRDAATGRIIAASDFFEPLTPGSLITPATAAVCTSPPRRVSSCSRSAPSRPPDLPRSSQRAGESLGARAWASRSPTSWATTTAM